VLDVQSELDLETLKNFTESLESPTLEEAEILGLEQAGVGERVCVDTASILEEGEGLLVGNTSDFFFWFTTKTLKQSIPNLGRSESTRERCTAISCREAIAPIICLS